MTLDPESFFCEIDSESQNNMEKCNIFLTTLVQNLHLLYFRFAN